MYRLIRNLVLAGFVLLALVGAVSGLSVTVSTDTPWLTAGDTATAQVTVTVVDGVAGAQVELSCNGTMGTLSPETLSGTGGVATFTPGTVSGSATITANYVGPDGTVMATNTTVVNIDHGTPVRVSDINYDDEVTAGSTTSIELSMVDRWGNPIDSRRTAETVHFEVGSPGDNARLIYGSNISTSLDVPVDAAGSVRVDIRTDTIPGANVVMVDCPGTISTGYVTITGTATGVPWGMNQTIVPNSDPYPYQKADGESVFFIVYSLYDQYGNAAGNRSIDISIVPQDGYLKAVEKTVTTNEEGQAMISYGPSDVAGIADIVASVVDNRTLNRSQRLEFVSTDPTSMLLSAVPQTVASRDVKNDISALIRAKVIDIKGNPVANESVSFQIVSVQNGTYVMTDNPEITNGTWIEECGGIPVVAYTDRTGFATVDFRPGAFTTDVENPRYSNLSVGEATVRALWGNQTRDIKISFRNYPYLSVKTWVEPPTVKVNNESATVTIQLIGDGWALHSRPIDVVLCTDRSGSMLYDNPDRMYSVREAAKQFVDNLSENDRASLVTFGRNTGSRNQIDVPGESSFRNPWYYINNNYNTPKKYLDYATVDLPLTEVLSSVKTELDNIVPDSGTPMRAGLYKSIKELSESGGTSRSSDLIQAIVLLSDGDYNWYGDPLARGRGYTYYSATDYGDLTQNYYKFSDLSNAEQNMAVYALNNNITIYSIGYADDISSGGKNTLKQLAESTGGKYYDGDAANIGEIYTAIAGELRTAASVNTTMSLVFKDIEINNVSGYSDVFTYQPIDGVSTRVTKYWQENLTTVSDAYPYSFDQTSDWADNEVSFTVGEIYLNQVWETKFCLNITEAGNINIFGNDSVIRFNGTEGQSELPLPETFVTAVKDLNVTPVDQGVVNVTITSAAWDGVSFLVPTWTLGYAGNQSVVQDVYYQYSSDNLWWDGVWNKFDTKGPTLPASVNGTYSSNLLVDGVNGWYKIRVHAQENVAGGASGIDEWTQPIHVGNITQNKIKLV